MSQDSYLFDTHALLFWYEDYEVSKEFITFFNKQNLLGRLYTSSVCFWEVALLVQKGRIRISSDMHEWASVLFDAGVRLLTPTVTEIINSVALPRHHKDPFDRLLIAQAIAQNMVLVTRDEIIQEYPVMQLWM
ncbi:MAG: type II toxin-antitoxin system VapC family toxin [Anaerolineales bacterium]|nr:type II toxin-antitoxin system VapC family toxin [Anaerolineales bacterium]